MKKLLRASAYVLAAGLFLFSFVPSVHAQVQPKTEQEAYALCTKAANNPCSSFDVAINPILIFQKARYTPDSPKSEAPSAMQDREGLCKQYSYAGSIHSGCVVGSGNMTFAGPVPGAAETGATQATDENGGTTVDPTGGVGTGDCSISHLDSCILNLPGYFFSALGFLLLTLSSLILGLAGVVFNWVVIRTVFQFALYFGTSAGMLVAWGVLRDIANIALLFTFIFVGIATILNTSSVEGYTAKKALPQLIIFAVLLNFSLFATQAVIDVANGFSSVFATYAGQQCDTSTSVAGGTSGESNAKCANLGISSKILEAAGMHQIIPSGDQALGSLSQALARPYTYTVMLILLSLMVTVTAMVLLAASIMLIIRVVVLSLLMVTSPIGFAGMAIPALHKIAEDWWHKLINQAFFAPLFLLMVFVSLKLVEGLQAGNATIADAILGNTASGATTAGNMQVVVIFMIVIGFMIGALMVAQKMGAYGASFATKTAAGLTLGAHGFVARRTVGRLSSGVANRIANSTWAQNNPGAGRLAYNIANKGATSSFSTRTLAGTMLKGTGVDFGKIDKDAAHGYHGMEEKAVKQRTEFAKKLGMTAKDKKDVERSEAEIADTSTEVRSIESDIEGRAKTNEEEQQAFRDAEQDQKNLDEQTLAPMRDRLKEKGREMQAARQAGDQNLLSTLEMGYNNDLRLYEVAEKEAQSRLADIRNSASRNKSEHDKQVSDLRKVISAKKEYIGAHADNIKNSKEQPQRRYAAALAHSGLPWPTLDSHANHEAAAKILKEINKSETERMRDALNAFNTRTASAPSAAPAAAPGGGGGAAPAADGHH